MIITFIGLFGLGMVIYVFNRLIGDCNVSSSEQGLSGV